MPRIALVALVLCSACQGPRERAPEDLDGLTRYIYRSFDDAEALEDGVENLAAWLDAEGDTEAALDGYRVTNLEERDVEGVPRPDGPLDDLIGAAAAYVSPYPLPVHSEANLERDQSWIDPDSYVRYERAIDEGDPDRFLDASGAIGTVNDIVKRGAFNVTIPFRSQKDFAWVVLEDAEVLVARGGILEGACSDNDRNCIRQSFTLDIWYGAQSGPTRRLTASWNHVTTEIDALLSREQKLTFAVDSIVETFENTDEYLAER